MASYKRFESVRIFPTEELWQQLLLLLIFFIKNIDWLSDQITDICLSSFFQWNDKTVRAPGYALTPHMFDVVQVIVADNEWLIWMLATTVSSFFFLFPLDFFFGVHVISVCMCHCCCCCCSLYIDNWTCMHIQREYLKRKLDFRLPQIFPNTFLDLNYLMLSSWRYYCYVSMYDKRVPPPTSQTYIHAYEHNKWAKMMIGNNSLVESKEDDNFVVLVNGNSKRV